MPWTVVVFEIDEDKVGAGSSEAGQATATFDFGDGQPVFVYSKRIQRTQAAAFVTEAKAKLAAYSTRRGREATLASNILSQLNA